MKAKMITGTALAVLFVFGFGGMVDHVSANQSQKNESTQTQSNSGMMGGAMMGQGMGQNQGMMSGGMMGTMGQMTTHHQQMSGLMNKLMENMTAIQNEKNPEALKTKLAEHQKLLEQMSGQMMQQGNRMQMMSGEVKQQCPGGADRSKP